MKQGFLWAAGSATLGRSRYFQPGGGRCTNQAFTLVEILVVLVILSMLAALSFPVLSRVIAYGQMTASLSNLHQLALANLAYTADNDGYFCPAQDPSNLIRWHGARTSSSAAFDPTQGYLAPYLGQDGRVKSCPLFLKMIKGQGSFETGTGGYGYNATYIGGTPQDTYQPIRAARVKNPGSTVMFTTTAFAKADGLQEYAFCEPFEWVDPNNQLSGQLQPSTHFRANGKALVAWCDGHVTAEAPSQLGGADYYGGDSKTAKLGWFGPKENNGYWNPNYTAP